jgi:hypothetical protein
VELSASERYVDTQQAFHLAEAGLDQVRDWLDGLGEPPVGTNSFDPCTNAAPPMCAVCPCRLADGQFAATIQPDPDTPTSYLDVFTVTVTGQPADIQLTRQVVEILRTRSFARFAYFTNSEELQWLGRTYQVWFTGSDHLTGPVHTNDEFNIAGNPIFDGEVSSVSTSINYRSGGPPNDNPQFNAGLALGAARITAPISAAKLRLAAASGGSWYEGNTTIRLQSNGTMLVTNAALGIVDQPTPAPSNSAVFVNGGNLTVSGTLDGKLTLGTSEDVIVDDSVTYLCDAENPASDPVDCDYNPVSGKAQKNDDLLGLVAEKNVVISDDAPYDVDIYGTIMALNSSFTVEQWWDPGNLKGTLHVFGGIIQDSRGAVGTFYSTTGAKRSGYSKDYVYDSRLIETAPPFYPTTGDYEKLLWQENN